MSYEGEASKEQIAFFEKHMTFEEAAILLHGGWSTKDEHAMYLAAYNVYADHKEKVKSKLMGKYYSNPKHNRRKESRRKNG